MSGATALRLLTFGMGALPVATAFWLLDNTWAWPVTLVLGIVLSEITWRAWKYQA